jgi:hypothetical protein
MNKEELRMESSIGDNAGRLWHYLSQKKAQTPATVAKALNLKSADVDRAIGWLAREGKLAFEKDVRGTVRISLK